MTITSAAVLLFLVMDPIGNIPLFLVALQSVPPARQKLVIIRELLIALFVLVAFLFAGAHLLQLFQFSESSLAIAGGVILFIIALRMVFPGPDGIYGEPVDQEPFIVPLAVPALAGPSAVATVMLMVSAEPDRWRDWLVAIIVAWSASAVILYLGAQLRHLLGRRGLLAAERLMGLVLTAVAVQMTLTGIRAFLRTL